MEPIELSVDEQIDLFQANARIHGTDSSLWSKGADLCLQRDIENNVGSRDRSEFRAYLGHTIGSKGSRMFGLDLNLVQLYINKGKSEKILTETDEVDMKVDIMYYALLGKDERNQLLDDDKVRNKLSEKLETYKRRHHVIAEDSREEWLMRTLEMYERHKILKEGTRGLELKQEIGKRLGKEIRKAVYNGISPSKDMTSKLSHDKETGDALYQARMIAKNTNTDPLEERQEKMKRKGLVREVINRKSQRGG